VSTWSIEVKLRVIVMTVTFRVTLTNTTGADVVTEAPVVTTAAPVVTTEAPVVATSAPVVTLPDPISV